MQPAAARLGCIATFGLAGCVAVPQGPTVAVMPGASKSYEQFQVDNGRCQQAAQSAISAPTQTAYNQVGASVAGSAAFGALIGALFGSVTGQAGYGAAWGAGTGALYGSAGASGYGAASSVALQQQYDAAYLQCMAGSGNDVPGRASTPWRGSAPAARVYRVPADAVAPPPGTPPPALRYGVPVDALAAPPGTPPPR